MTTRSAVSRALATEGARSAVTIWTVVLLISGQGFRYLLGLPIYGALCVATVAAVFLVFRPTLRTLRPPALIGAFVGLAALSIVWSATRAITVVAVIALVATTAIAMITARGASNIDFMLRLYRGLQVSLFLGILFELVVAFIIRSAVPPLVSDLESLAETRGGDPRQSNWSENLLLEGGPVQGFVGNRNPFGGIALLVAVVACVLLLDRGISRLDGWVTLGAAAAVHAVTMSATVTASVAVLGALTVGAYVLRRLRPRAKRVLSFTIIACSAIGAVMTLKYREAIFELLERGSDFTHRTEIWYEVINFAMQRPDGWGYVGYWPIWQYPYSEIGTGLEWVRPTHAHNAFLDAWLQLGLIGVVLLVGIVVLLFGSAWRLVERADRGDTHLPLGWALLTVALVMQALTESRLLVEGGWFLLVALYCIGPPVFTLTIVDPELVHYGTRMRKADEARVARRIDAAEERHGRTARD
ncbi:O-antigen ligase family protein [Demequina aestuarii]|uniref:O-antigen ligase family protein n=1 Tax=Demequina aestuarii TaxID=327095 RepID=UPI00187CA6F0|nr:O-antigen ligase family protein [Demequina aestuarii]